ncbi:hypothetical protein [Methylobacter tundripaludum]|uniref:Uncharacterized protein n=1 Tax=Methylobacter tundripaludum (strain ATCC BAA-1195 / DSM 17260 / SV96) TaxID=697282 RepID=G3IZH0_METTV|nr:hypothetical protein [Methylobacter tundripaludum]EGW20342.1 hypothetical protein Mettu_3473 [Methylobacter tundripaludum SV96]
MKRNLFDELSEGFDALAEQRQGKRTLRTHDVEMKPAPELAAAELVALREPCRVRCAYHRTLKGTRSVPYETGTVLINWIFIKESIFLYFMVEKLNRLT